MPFHVGDRLGHYDVTAFIGEGGMGQVFRSIGTWLDRTVAINVRASATVQRVCWGLVAAALLTGTVRAQQSPIEAVGSIPHQTIGVMPFANISRADADRWIGAGIAETLAADLQNRPGIEVLDLGTLRPAVRSGTTLRRDALDDGAALRIGREHGLTWLIAGGYQRVGDQLRITARLVEVETGAVHHTARVDGSIDELFVLQDQVVEAVGARLGPSGWATSPETRSRVVVPVAQPDRFPVPPTAHVPVPPTPVAPTPATAVAPPAVLEEARLLAYEGPPLPALPETIARDAAGRVTVRGASSLWSTTRSETRIPSRPTASRSFATAPSSSR